MYIYTLSYRLMLHIQLSFDNGISYNKKEMDIKLIPAVYFPLICRSELKSYSEE